MPPPEAVVPLARLPLTGLPALVSGPCTQTPPPTAARLLVKVQPLSARSPAPSSTAPPLLVPALPLSKRVALTVTLTKFGKVLIRRKRKLGVPAAVSRRSVAPLPLTVRA